MIKKHYKKFFSIFIVCILFFTFSLTTSAESSGWRSAVFNSYSNKLTNTVTQSTLTGRTAANGDGMLWTLPATYPWMGDVVDFYVRANMSISLTSGDRFQIQDKTIYGWFGGQENYIISIRYILGYEFTTENANGQKINGIKFINHAPWQRYEFQGGASYGLNLPAAEFDITQDVSNCFIAIQFKCTRDSSVANDFTINNFNFHYGYGNPNSSEYPGFNKVNPNSANNLENAENQLKNDTISGVNKAYNTFSSFTQNLQPYFKSITVVTNVMNSALQRLPFLGHLFNISLGIGLFSFIVGMVGFAVGASEKKQMRSKMREEKRQIWREEARSHYASKE